MPRTHGYSPKGERCYGVHDWRAKGRTNVIGALLGTALITISLFACSIDTQTFTEWLIQDLLPKLPAKCVIILDNASFHKGKDMLKAVEEAGHILLYLPPYSPDLNLIEPKWAQAKAVRRKYRCDIQQLFTRYLV
jgi:transposase